MRLKKLLQPMQDKFEESAPPSKPDSSFKRALALARQILHENIGSSFNAGFSLTWDEYEACFFVELTATQPALLKDNLPRIELKTRHTSPVLTAQWVIDICDKSAELNRQVHVAAQALLAEKA